MSRFKNSILFILKMKTENERIKNKIKELIIQKKFHWGTFKHLSSSEFPQSWKEAEAALPDHEQSS